MEGMILTESNINAAMFKNMVVSAANYLEHNKQLKILAWQFVKGWNLLIKQ